MNRSERRAATQITCYVLIGFLTGGYFYNKNSKVMPLCEIPAVMAGIAWPVYWTARASIWATSWAKPEATVQIER